MTQRRIVQYGSLACLVAVLAPTVRPVRAESITEAPTAVGTLTVTEASSPNPNSTLSQGGAILTDFTEGRYGGSYAESALKFDLTSLGSGDQIISATFSFTVASAETVLGTPSLNVGGYTSNSPMVTLTDFATTSTLLGNTGNLPSAPPMVTPIQLDVTNFLRASLVGGASDIGFLLSDPTDSNVEVYGNDPSNPSADLPTLTINFASVPEPASATTLGFGMAGLVVLAWRHRRSSSHR